MSFTHVVRRLASSLCPYASEDKLKQETTSRYGVARELNISHHGECKQRFVSAHKKNVPEKYISSSLCFPRV
jgi:hypothetical protein